MQTGKIRSIGVLALLVTVGACGPGRSGPGAPRPSGDEAEWALPEIPRRTAPLRIDVVHPAEGSTVAARDSTFVFGSTGTGEASLWINGTPVRVEANGAFLAFLPVPADGVYRVAARAGADTASLVRTVNVPAAPPTIPAGVVAIVEGSVTPRGAWSALPGERIDVSFRGTPGGRATLVLPDGRRVPMVEDVALTEASWGQQAFAVEPGTAGVRRIGGVSTYRGYFEAVPLRAADPSVPQPTLARYGAWVDEAPVIAATAGEAVEAARGAAPFPEGTAYVELTVDGETVRAPLQLNVALLDPTRPPVGVVRDPGAFGTESDSIVVARPTTGGTYLYFWPDGTEITLTGERGGEYRVRLTETLSAWVGADAVILRPAGTPPPTGRIGTVRMTPRDEWVDVRVAMPARLPFRVDEDERSISLTIYGGTGNTDWLQYGATDPLIEWADWSAPADEVYRLTLRLSERPWGYRTFWTPNGDLVLRVRRTPDIDPDRPLRGLVIAVDPGHPPAGAIGPTRLTEAEANLAIALKLLPMLERAGARVVMTRTDTTAVPLVWRPILATREDADILVSIHNNAFPDGVNPFVNNGTSVYYFHPHSVDLARAFQDELLEELRLRDLGIGRSNLALVRPTWMPSALTETMYLMIPRQEAALRDPSVQERIARAHLRALETFARGRAEARR